MHNNYFFLRQLSQRLENTLKGTVISECYSQEKDELILRFETSAGSFFIKTSVLPALSCLSFPRNFQRARKNSVDLFPMLIGQRVGSIQQFNNERSFALRLSNGFDVLFKMHANRSNVIVFENDKSISLFRKNLVADVSLKLETLDREIDWSFEAFQRNENNLKGHYFTFGKLVWRYLNEQGFDSKNTEQKWMMIQHLLSELRNPRFYITTINDVIALSLVKTGVIKKEESDPLSAANEFYHNFIQTSSRTQEKMKIFSLLKNRLAGSESYRDKNQLKLSELTHDNHYKMWADLIMANLHAISPGMEHVTLHNFYDEGKPTEIKLKKELNAQKNAELYYRKSKNQHLETDRLQRALAQKDNEIVLLRELIKKLEATDNPGEIEEIRKKTEHSDSTTKPSEHLPYHEFNFAGYRIWVGRNAQANDVLTFKLGYKEDLWLHAKDVAGSHVLIKYQAGKKFPKDVIERAAELAAYNSKRKTETLCPVIVTPRKFVRKRKGDPAGAVVVEREEVILVEPKLAG